MALMTTLPGIRSHQGLSLRMSDATILCGKVHNDGPACLGQKKRLTLDTLSWHTLRDGCSVV